MAVVSTCTADFTYNTVLNIAVAYRAFKINLLESTDMTYLIAYAHLFPLNRLYHLPVTHHRSLSLNKMRNETDLFFTLRLLKYSLLHASLFHGVLTCLCRFFPFLLLLRFRFFKALLHPLPPEFKLPGTNTFSAIMNDLSKINRINLLFFLCFGLLSMLTFSLYSTIH